MHHSSDRVAETVVEGDSTDVMETEDEGGGGTVPKQPAESLQKALLTGKHTTRQVEAY